MKLKLIILLCIFSVNTLLAQVSDKEVKKILSEAKQLYERNELEKSLSKFLLADSLSPQDPFINYQIGHLYSYQSMFVKGLPYLQVAASKGYKGDSIEYYTGKGLHLSHRFDEAIASYRLFKQNTKLPRAKEEMINRLIENCNYGIQLMKDSIQVKITNLGPLINSEYPEYLPLISADENTIIFTSRRSTSTGGKLDPFDHQYFEDIYISHKDDEIWTNPVPIGKNINTDNHDAGVAISSDGQEMFMYKGDVNGGDLFVSSLHGTEWSEPTPLNQNINTKAWEFGACISSNERIIFFTSNKKGGVGGTDIYFSVKNNNGEFGPAKLLGPQVNTPYDENSPFLQSDGKTLYFSSQGHNSIGGFDIFSVSIDPLTGQVLSNSQNIGFPINTADDDVFFVWSADSKRGYFSSKRQGGFGEKDLYVLERPVKENPVVLLEGIIKDCETGKPLEAKIVVTNNTTKQVEGVFHSNSTTGKYVIILPANVNFGIEVEIDAPHYLFYSKNIDNTELQKYRQIVDSICIERVSNKRTLTLKNIFFDINKATLRGESFLELRKLLTLLEENPEFKIKIIGHTDDNGSAEHNLRLSKDRSKTVSAYLTGHGIPESRLSSDGMGESEPAAPNDTEENKQRNRRIEIQFSERQL